MTLALLTDLYQLTMAYGYWKTKMVSHRAVFHLFFRKATFHGGFTIAAGLAGVIGALRDYRFSRDDLDYLATLRDGSCEPYFEEPFLRFLEALRLTCDVDAMEEGTVVFPYEPLLRIEGPLLECQLLESLLLNCINFPTLIATKAARVVLAARGDPVLEFGVRRAQGIDGALTASRAAYIGGCAATSNLLAGKRFGIPVRGTHAHSWVMAFESEEEAFRSYAEAMPNNCLFLVDTYDTLEGVQRAIEVGKWLRERGRPFLGIRLDSGDLASLSIESRKLLDAAGFPDAKICASNELDEYLIADLKMQGAQIAIWGVGTHLVTGQGQPALDGVYKLSAIAKPGEPWRYCLKCSERMSKVSDPGILQVRRYFSKGLAVGDLLYDAQSAPSERPQGVDLSDPTLERTFSREWESQELLVPIFRKGELVYREPTLEEIRARASQNLAGFDRSMKRFTYPQTYPVVMERQHYALKLKLTQEVRERYG